MEILLAEVRIMSHFKGEWGKAGESGGFERRKRRREPRVGTLLSLEMKLRHWQEKIRRPKLGRKVEMTIVSSRGFRA
jgi:hypothetical protein